MYLRCPRCGEDLELDRLRTVTANLQCPGCGAVFGVDDGEPRSGFQRDEVIDVHAEVLSHEPEPSFRGKDTEDTVAIEQAPITGYGYRPGNAPNVTRQIFLMKNNGCGCSGCGCLALIFLVLFLLFGCAATAAL